MSWTLFLEVAIFASLMGIVAWALFVPPQHLRKTRKNDKDEKDKGGNEDRNQ